MTNLGVNSGVPCIPFVVSKDQNVFTPFVACADINLYWKIVLSSVFIISYASISINVTFSLFN